MQIHLHYQHLIHRNFHVTLLHTTLALIKNAEVELFAQDFVSFSYKIDYHLTLKEQRGSVYFPVISNLCISRFVIFTASKTIIPFPFTLWHYPPSKAKILSKPHETKSFISCTEGFLSFILFYYRRQDMRPILVARNLRSISTLFRYHLLQNAISNFNFWNWFETNHTFL